MSAPPKFVDGASIELVVHPGSDDVNFVYGERSYGRRVGDQLHRFKFSFSQGLAERLTAVYDGSADAETTSEVGAAVQGFLQVELDSSLSRITICSDAPEVYALPFELASRGATWLGLHAGVSIRYRWPDVVLDPRGDDHGRILFAWAMPEQSVPHGEHATALQRSCPSWLTFDHQRDVARHASRDNIAERLRESEGQVRVLHLLCHGKQIRQGQYGLVLEGGNVTSATALATTLEPFCRTLRLVVLCACRGGDQGPEVRQMGSVARELHRVGIPWVIASRLPLRIDDSITITEHFYRGLLSGVGDIDRSLADTRRVLYDAPNHKYEWASPQLRKFAADAARRCVDRPDEPIPLYIPLSFFDSAERGPLQPVFASPMSRRCSGRC